MNARHLDGDQGGRISAEPCVLHPTVWPMAMPKGEAEVDEQGCKVSHLGVFVNPLTSKTPIFDKKTTFYQPLLSEAVVLHENM